MAGKLSLDALDVTSFVVSPETAEPSNAIIITSKTTDPTAMTWCFICPVERIDPVYVAPAPAQPIDGGFVVAG